MRRTPWALCLWPGLPQLWLGGNAKALVVAVAAAAVLNLALVSTFGFTELLTPTLRAGLWAGLAIGLLAGGVSGGTWLRQFGRGPVLPARDLLPEARDHYLQGNWYEAERIFGQALAACPADVDARLMLAGLLRRRRRWDEAAAALDQLAALDGAVKWSGEIQRERQLIQEGRRAAELAEAESTEAESTEGPSAEGSSQQSGDEAEPAEPAAEQGELSQAA